MLYTFAGTSVLKGDVKVRFANSDARAKQLAKLGDTAINIVELPSAMDKAGAVAYLLTLPAFADVQDALRAEVAPRAKAKPARTVKMRVSKVKAVKAKAVKAPVEVTEAEVDALMQAAYGTK
jgi:ppGpp synthetase/RelA/SpoT-type nucleotidyltranferase